MTAADQLQSWLTSSDFEIYTPPVFECDLVLHRTKLFGPGIASIINGSTTAASFNAEPGWFKFNWLLEVLGRASNRDPGHFFEIRCGSNGYNPEVSPLRAHDFTNNQFSGGAQGVLAALDSGAAAIVLAPYSRAWLLQCDGGDEFAMTLSGSADFCETVAARLGMSR